MDRAEIAQLIEGELQAARGSLAAAMNNLSGPHGTQHRSCIKEMYFACFHMATALLASNGIRARSHDALQELLALHFVKPAALQRETTARLNDLMDKRHVADYKPYIPIGREDIDGFRPWVAGFVRAVLKLIDKAAPAREAGALQRAADDFEKMRLE